MVARGGKGGLKQRGGKGGLLHSHPTCHPLKRLPPCPPLETPLGLPRAAWRRLPGGSAPRRLPRAQVVKS